MPTIYRDEKGEEISEGLFLSKTLTGLYAVRNDNYGMEKTLVPLKEMFDLGEAKLNGTEEALRGQADKTAHDKLKAQTREMIRDEARNQLDIGWRQELINDARRAEELENKKETIKEIKKSHLVIDYMNRAFAWLGLKLGILELKKEEEKCGK